MTIATIKPPPISFGSYAWRIPDHRDRCSARRAYRELRRHGIVPLAARCLVQELLTAGMNGRTLVEAP